MVIKPTPQIKATPIGVLILGLHSTTERDRERASERERKRKRERAREREHLSSHLLEEEHVLVQDGDPVVGHEQHHRRRRRILRVPIRLQHREERLRRLGQRKALFMNHDPRQREEGPVWANVHVLPRTRKQARSKGNNGNQTVASTRMKTLAQEARSTLALNLRLRRGGEGKQHTPLQVVTKRTLEPIYFARTIVERIKKWVFIASTCC